jgi:hypothetical protein
MMRTANLLKMLTTSKDFLDLSCLISSTLLDHPATNNSHAFSLLCYKLSGEKISAAIRNHRQNQKTFLYRETSHMIGEEGCAARLKTEMGD